MKHQLSRERGGAVPAVLAHRPTTRRTVSARARRRRGQRGQVFVVFALLFVVLVGFAGLVVDTSRAYDVSRKDQHVADAAALAATTTIYNNVTDSGFTASHAAALQVAADDGCSGSCGVTLTYQDSCNVAGVNTLQTLATYSSSGTLTVYSVTCNGVTATGQTGGSCFDPSTGPSFPCTDRVKADVADRYSELFMDAVSGISSTPIAETATAKVSGGTLGLSAGYPLDCSLCFYSTGDDLDISNGVNGITLTSGAANIDGNGTIGGHGNNNYMYINNGYQVKTTQSSMSSSWTVQCQTNPSCGSPLVAYNQPTFYDVLQTLPRPACAGAAPVTGCTYYGDVTTCPGGALNPGVYGTISPATSSCRITFNPGVYIFAGGSSAGLQLSASGADLEGSGVTWYFTCGNAVGSAGQGPQACSSGGENGATINWTGQSSTFNVTAPTSGTYNNMLIFFDRNNNTTISLAPNNLNHGCAACAPTGAVYARSAPMISGGNSMNLSTLSPYFIYSLLLEGNGFGVGNNVRVGSMPQPGGLII